MPIIGRAKAEIRRRKPKIATSHGVDVVPNVAPTMTPTACEKVTRPALTKPITVSVVAVEDWIATVKSAPDTIALNRPPTIVLKHAAQRVAGEALEAFGKMVDPEQEQAEPTHDSDRGGGVQSTPFSAQFS